MENKIEFINTINIIVQHEMKYVWKFFTSAQNLGMYGISNGFIASLQRRSLIW